MFLKFRGFFCASSGVFLILLALLGLYGGGPLQVGLFLIALGCGGLWWGQRLMNNDAPRDPYIKAVVNDSRLQMLLFKEHAWHPIILIALNLIPFYLINMSSGAHMELSREMALKWGANSSPLVASGQIWRLLSAAFLHSGLPHFLGNMIALLTVGRYIDYYFGSKNLYFIYFASALAASLCSGAYHPLGISVGASGAIFGLYGAFAMMFIVAPPNKGKLQFSRLAVLYIVMHMVQSLAAGFKDYGIDNAAHLGGLACGAALGFFILQAEYSFTHIRNFTAAALAAALLLLNLTVYRHLPSPSQLQAREARLRQWHQLAEHGRKFALTADKLQRLFLDTRDHKISEAQMNAQWETRFKPELEALRSAVYYQKVTDNKAYQAQLDLYNAITSMTTHLSALVSPDPTIYRRALASSESQNDKTASSLKRALATITSELQKEI